jgi:hypothetical protein
MAAEALLIVAMRRSYILHRLRSPPGSENKLLAPMLQEDASARPISYLEPWPRETGERRARTVHVLPPTL